MVKFDKDHERDEMSIEDILASIRKYVTNGDNDVSQQQDEQPQQDAASYLNDEVTVVDLEQSQVMNQKTADEESVLLNENVAETNSQVIFSESTFNTEAPVNPFGKLTNALKSYGHPKKQNKQLECLTIDKFLENLAVPIIETWLNNNLERIVEQKVDENIEKIKNDCSV
jgi:cell pole-organizing protein PopZ